jgi:hypothetical protein
MGSERIVFASIEGFYACLFVFIEAALDESTSIDISNWPRMILCQKSSILMVLFAGGERISQRHLVLILRLDSHSRRPVLNRYYPPVIFLELICSSTLSNGRNHLAEAQYIRQFQVRLFVFGIVGRFLESWISNWRGVHGHEFSLGTRHDNQLQYFSSPSPKSNQWIWIEISIQSSTLVIFLLHSISNYTMPLWKWDSISVSGQGNGLISRLVAWYEVVIFFPGSFLMYVRWIIWKEITMILWAC